MARVFRNHINRVSSRWQYLFKKHIAGNRNHQTRFVAIVLPLVVLMFMIVNVSPLLAAEEVPLNGKFSGIGNDFSGVVSHLGKFEGVFNPVAGTAVWTAANRDTLSNQTTSFVLVEEVEPGVYTYIQTLIFTGGSGRFENASGSATITGLFNFITGEYDGLMTGNISRPNS